MTKYISSDKNNNASTEFLELSLESASSRSLSIESSKNISKVEITIPSNNCSFEKKQLSLSTVPAELTMEIVKCFLTKGDC